MDSFNPFHFLVTNLCIQYFQVVIHNDDSIVSNNEFMGIHLSVSLADPWK